MSSKFQVVSTLKPTGSDSPSSSVFDLPVHSSNNLKHVSDTYTPPDGGTNDYNSFLVVSGGTGGNAVCSAFGIDTCYVLPVSDDGGSSSEIIRVLGGPSIGELLRDFHFHVP